jgi:hypothetical protein
MARLASPIMSWMSSLKRREELRAQPPIGVDDGGDREVWVIGSPIRVVLLSEDARGFPIWMLLLPAVTADPATTPMAMLLFKEPLFGSA